MDTDDHALLSRNTSSKAFQYSTLAAFSALEFLHMLAKKSWVESTFSERECITYIPTDRYTIEGVCCCGKEKVDHVSNANFDSVSNTNINGESKKWNWMQDTTTYPTKAFGTLELQGAMFPNTAKFIRLSVDSKPPMIYDLLVKEWNLPPPALIISVVGGLQDFSLQSQLQQAIQKGIIGAAKSTEAWVFTDGINSGVSKVIGAALETRKHARRVVPTIGIASWGIVAMKESLVGVDITVPYHSSSYVLGATVGVTLNPGHSCFLLSDDGTEHKFGPHLHLRKSLEEHLNSTIQSLLPAPKVVVLIEGGLSSLRICFSNLSAVPPSPVVVVDGSGRAADLLTFFCDKGVPYMANNSVKQHILSLVTTSFGYSESEATATYEVLIQCLQYRSSIFIYRMEERGLDHCILSALCETVDDPVKRLHLSLKWNRPDVAETHVFPHRQVWPENSLEEIMMMALVGDNVEFVKMMFENRLSFKPFLSINMLEDLYNSQPMTSIRQLMKHVKPSLSETGRVTLLDIGILLERLMGGCFRCFYTRKQFKAKYTNTMKEGKYYPSPFEFPSRELLCWAILTDKPKMANFMWQIGSQPLEKALIASQMYKRMASDIYSLGFGANENYELLRSNFNNLSVEILEIMWRENQELTCQVLTYAWDSWSLQTCLSIAAASGNKDFVAHPACQTLLNDLWMGGLNVQRNITLKVLGCIICPPCLLYVQFKTVQQLELMPQTLEEYTRGEKCPSSSGSIAGDENMAIDDDTTGYLFGQPGKIIEKSAPRELHWRKKVYEFYNAPITIFWANTLMFICFLCCLTYVILVKPNKYPGRVEIFTILYVFALALEELREFFLCEATNVNQKFKLWSKNYWSMFRCFSITMFLIAEGIRQHYLIESRILLALNASFWFISILEIYTVNQVLGPYVKMVGKMSVQMIYFSMLIVVMVMSFGVARQSIHFPDEEPSWKLVRDIFYKPYWMIYGELFAPVLTRNDDCGDPPDHEFPCVAGSFFTPLLMAIFLLMTNILLVNFMISAFNNTYFNIAPVAQCVWKHQRYFVVLYNEMRPVFPPPFGILLHIYSFFTWIINRCWNSSYNINDRSLKLFLHGDEIQKLYKFENKCLRLYLRQNEKILANSADKQSEQMLSDIGKLLHSVEELNTNLFNNKKVMSDLETKVNALESVGVTTLSAINNIQTQLNRSLKLSDETHYFQTNDTKVGDGRLQDVRSDDTLVLPKLPSIVISDPTTHELDSGHLTPPRTGWTRRLRTISAPDPHIISPPRMRSRTSVRPDIGASTSRNSAIKKPLKLYSSKIRSRSVKTRYATIADNICIETASFLGETLGETSHSYYGSLLSFEGLTQSNFEYLPAPETMDSAASDIEETVEDEWIRKFDKDDLDQAVSIPCDDSIQGDTNVADIQSPGALHSPGSLNSPGRQSPSNLAKFASSEDFDI